ncbi:MAG: MFS transporter [Oceanospirillaceae bacterium]|nr:MFS transporter [Oceanospirillaceae bacterium]
MSPFSSTAQARFATRVSFFTAGFVMACCAPFFPFIKLGVGADEGQFGLLLLCFGLGSIVSMPIVGVISARHGAKSMVLLGGFGLIIFLPALVLAQTPLILAITLFVFGASLGAMDVAMNVHGVQVEAQEKRSLMSSFHAQFSIGALCGAGLMTLLLSLKVALIIAALTGAAVALVAMILASSRLLNTSAKEPTPLVLPQGIVLLLGFLAAIAFLVEGAVLDWGALLIIDRQIAAPENAGLGYLLFSIAMVIARLTGDSVIGALGEFWVLILSGIISMLGIATVLLTTHTLVALAGFVLIGLGSAIIVPILFSAAGRQKVMPASLAIAAVTTTGYAGVLIGPAMIGFTADLTSISTAFWLLIGLVALIPVTAYLVVEK